MKRNASMRCFPPLLAATFFILTTQVLWAHAILMQSSPAQNATVAGPNVPITLRFNVRVDGSRSRLHLVSPGGQQTTLPATQSAPDTLQARAVNLKPGSYKLLWQVLASDGHMSRGEVLFNVK